LGIRNSKASRSNGARKKGLVSGEGSAERFGDETFDNQIIGRVQFGAEISLGDPHARQRAVEIARREPPPGISQDEAVALVENVLSSIGDTCPECN